MNHFHEPISFSNMERCFRYAASASSNHYFGIEVEINGATEYIINPMRNLESKLEYYKNTYDENLNHKFADGIRIVWYSFGATFYEIEYAIRSRKYATAKK